jgi:hypothetical protein
MTNERAQTELGLRLIGGSAVERATATCAIGLHSGIVPSPSGDLLARCRICGTEWRLSDLSRPMTPREWNERP